MNVLMTTDCAGGVWSYALDLANALAEHRVGVTLAAIGRPSAAQLEELRRSRVEDWCVRDYALEWQQDWPSVERSCDWLREIGELSNADLVHVNGYVHAALGWPQPVVLVAHSCVLSWHEAVRGQVAPPEWDRYRAEVARGLDAADLVVAPTDAMLAALRRHHPVPCEARVIPNGIFPAEEAAERREVVLAAGRIWDEAKNVAALARVAPRLDVQVELVGEGGPEGSVGRDELRRRMAAAAVFCAPARYEPFGLAPLEAASAGCALVLGDIPSLRELWEGAALFVDPADDDALELALRRALADCEALGALARRRARRYSAARMAAGYLDAYRSRLRVAA
jgi:glycogen synthase